MALRINYVDNHHMELWRGKRFGARDRLAPVLPIVIYTGGPTRWTAASRVIDLVTPTSAPVAETDLVSRASGLFAGDGYLTLDTQQVPADDLRHDKCRRVACRALQPSAGPHSGGSGGTPGTSR